MTILDFLTDAIFLRTEHAPLPHMERDFGERISMQGEEYSLTDSRAQVPDNGCTCDCDYVDDGCTLDNSSQTSRQVLRLPKMASQLLLRACLFDWRMIPFSVTFCGMQVRSMKLQWCCDYHSALTTLIGECLCLQSIACCRKLKPK